MSIGNLKAPKNKNDKFSNENEENFHSPSDHEFYFCYSWYAIAVSLTVAQWHVGLPGRDDDFVANDHETVAQNSDFEEIEDLPADIFLTSTRISTTTVRVTVLVVEIGELVRQTDKYLQQ